MAAATALAKESKVKRIPPLAAHFKQVLLHEAHVGAEGFSGESAQGRGLFERQPKG